MIETTSLYGGEIICEFNAARHTYTIVNKGRRYKVPSVTRITSIIDKSGPLVNWAINNTLDVCRGAISPGSEYAESYLDAVWGAAKKASQQIKSDAAQRGKDAHSFIETELKASQGIDGNDSIELDRPVLQWLRSFRIEAIERRVYSRRFRYSGTFDVVGYSREDERLYLIDWKTGKSIYPEFRLQTAAYVHAYEEEFPDQRIEGRYLVRIAEDGSIEPHFYPRSSLRLDFKAFLGAKALFDRIKQIEKADKKK